MALVQYPDWLPQCEPTTRTEVTKILSETSDNGVIRGRVMYASPTYQLLLSHNALSMTLFDQWEAWWEANLQNEVEVVWWVDNKTYRGIVYEPPEVEYQAYETVNLTVNLLVKKV